jgi:hypothetical protein
MHGFCRAKFFGEKNSPTKVGAQFLRHQLRTEVRSMMAYFFTELLGLMGFATQS